MTNKYSFLIGLEKTFFRMVIIAGPVVLELLPSALLNITLGAALTFLINYAKNKDKAEEQDAPSQG